MLNKDEKKQEEFNEYEKKLSDLKCLVCQIDKKIADIDCEIRKLNNDIEFLELQKKKVYCRYDKVIAVVVLFGTMPILFKVLYKFITSFGMDFIEATDIVIKHGYGLFILLGGVSIIFGGPVLIRELIDVLIRGCSKIVVKSLRYKSLIYKIEDRKKQLEDLNLCKYNILREKSEIIFECSKYNALLKLREFPLNGIDNNVIIDDRNYENDMVVKPYTRRKKR